jgi:Tfp pilus assembly protein PilF
MSSHTHAVKKREKASVTSGMTVIQEMVQNALRYHRAGQLSEAERLYLQVLEIDGNHADSLHLLGVIAFQSGRHNVAVQMIRKAIAINKNGASYYSNLGNALQAQGKLDEAAEEYRHSLVLRPDSTEVRVNLGNVLRLMGNLDEALVQYRKALSLKPNYPPAALGEALVQLHQGDFAAGWHNFEIRWQSEDHGTPRRTYQQPLWKGDKLTSGRLLIWGEQGIGDEIMFAGLLSDVLRTGNHCVLDCDARLKPLFARSFPEMDVVAGNAMNCPLGFTAHVPIGSLPSLFRTTTAAFAATTSPYLTADPAQRERFRERYNDGKRLVGLAWHTSNQNAIKMGRNRSMDLSWFAPLFEHSDIRWISLQYGDHDFLEAQAATAGAPIFIDRSVDQLSDIDMFAAQVAAMDMVITIDNSTAHLAGALGVPVWTLLPFASDWRWLQTRGDSPWYPTMCLFRQPKPGDWQSVMQRVNDALSNYPGLKGLKAGACENKLMLTSGKDG